MTTLQIVLEQPIGICLISLQNISFLNVLPAFSSVNYCTIVPDLQAKKKTKTEKQKETPVFLSNPRFN